MSNFNPYLNTHFSAGGCRLIARARDTCRNRDVALYAIPGHWDVVGVSDGTDAWVAPASAGPFFKTATGDVAQIMRALQLGEPMPPVPDMPQARRRAVLTADPEDAVPRKRAALNDDEPVTTETTTRRRNHVRFA